MNDGFITPASKAGTAGGIVIILLVNINSGDILKTITLAALGAVVSFTVSICLKWMIRRLKKTKPLNDR
jgi:mannitol-specific phosphotransferase system IIBC component